MGASEIPHITYQQYRTARRLVHECCNYDCGNCLLLDNGEECVCPQQMVPRRRPSSGRRPVRRIVPAFLCQTAALPGVREAVCPAQAQHSLLLHLCRRTGETEQASMGQEKPG